MPLIREDRENFVRGDYPSGPINGSVPLPIPKRRQSMAISGLPQYVFGRGIDRDIKAMVGNRIVTRMKTVTRCNYVHQALSRRS
jgi:hypothetical protein